MRFTQKTIFSFILSLLFIACAKNDSNTEDQNQGPNTEQDLIDMHDGITMAAAGRAKLLELAPQSDGDPKLALMQSLEWAQGQEGVEKTYHFDSTYLFIEMASGLTSLVWINELDEEGVSKYRGSGSGKLKAFLSEGGCSNIMENKKVLIYSPNDEEFRYSFKSKVPEFLQNNSKIEDFVFLKDEQGTIESIKTFGNYGLVLIETHGSPRSFLTGEFFEFGESEIPEDYIQFRDALLAQIGQEYYDLLLNGKLMVAGEVNFDPLDINWWSNGQEEFESGKFQLHVTGKFLEDIPSLDGTIVFGNFCFSGWTVATEDVPLPIGQAFLNRNPVSYYAYLRSNGYSLPVDNYESMEVEDTLVRGFLVDNDSTGIAHLKADGTPFKMTSFEDDLFFAQMGPPDWCWEGCGEPLVDDRDGQEKVYETVCIGDQVWMAENLNYEMPGSLCYDNDPTLCDSLGRLYNREAALEACPEGWHLPSQDEWFELRDFLGGSNVAGGKMKSINGWNPPNVGATNSSGFSGIGSGSFESDNFFGLGLGAAYWTSDDPGNSDYARVFILRSDIEYGDTGNGLKTGSFSVRCLKD